MSLPSGTIHDPVPVITSERASGVRSPRAGEARVNDVELREFIAERWHPMVRVAMSLGLGLSDAEDVVQTVLIKLVSRPRRLRRIENLDAYCARMVINATKDLAQRAHKRYECLADEPAGERIQRSGDPEDRDNLIVVRAALASLDAGQREPLVLKHYLRMTDPEIAATLGVPLGTVKSRISRGTERLQQLLQNQGINHA